MNTEFEIDREQRQAIQNPEGRPKTPLRMTYEAEVRVFRSKYGGIEDVRRALGFSRRKMCLLLLVDPSAWTRWMRDENRVPPHVYRSLEWYLALEKKLKIEPELASLLLKERPNSEMALSELRLALESQAVTIRHLRRAVISLAAGLVIVGLFITLR
jgi:hypothetical protein